MTNPNQLYEDMAKLNALYEELLWGHEDVLEFVADYENDRIIIRTRLTTDEKVRTHLEI